MKFCWMKNIRNRHRRRGGDALILFVGFVIAIFAFAALAIDLGNVYVHRKRILEAAETAALGAVVSWASSETASQTIAIGEALALTNGLINVEIVSIEPGKWTVSTTNFTPLSTPVLPTLTSDERAAVRVTTTRTVQMAFARVFGMTQMQPRTKATAVVGTARCVDGPIPFGVCTDGLPPAVEKCTPFTLHFEEDPGPGVINACDSPPSGRYGPLRMPGQQGGNDLRNNIRNGFPGQICIGDCVGVEPGNMAGPIGQGLNDRLQGLPGYVCTPTSDPPANKRAAITLEVQNMNTQTPNTCNPVVGFRSFVLDSFVHQGNTVLVNARFINVFSGAVIDLNTPPVPGSVLTVALVE
jgi:Flp pilus assembly protein TadG